MAAAGGPWSTSGDVLVLVVAGWVLLAPPYGGSPFTASERIGCGDPGHLDECASLGWWRKFGGVFPDADACRRARDAGIAAARSDDEWADWQLARCFTEERVRNGPGLRPGE
jgi:hypothetical protein